MLGFYANNSLPISTVDNLYQTISLIKEDMLVQIMQQKNDVATITISSAENNFITTIDTNLFNLSIKDNQSLNLTMQANLVLNTNFIIGM